MIHYIEKGKPWLALFLIWDILLKKAWHYLKVVFESPPDIMSYYVAVRTTPKAVLQIGLAATRV